MEVEKDLLSSQDQCIQLTEQITKLEAEIVSLKHSKETVENSRDVNLKKLTEKYQERESQLVSAIEALQARYCKKNSASKATFHNSILKIRCNCKRA